ncbi:MAG: hypothetical protein U5L10_02585 [Candidatus Moranbacteria bacterium]|nr:hypothetical protein [Candidatus Moranbacteria bacterium]
MSKKPGKASKKKIARKVFEDINKNQVKMKSHCNILFCKILWIFLAFLAFVLALYIGSLSMNYLISFKPFSVLRNNLFFIPAFYPFLLIGVVAALVYAASRFYREGRSRCRHEEWMLLGALFFTTIAVLFFSARTGTDEHVFKATEKSDLGKQIFVSRYNYWSIPEKGTLSGLVAEEVRPLEIYKIRDWRGRSWHVLVDRCPEDKRKMFETQARVKMIGQKDESADNLSFSASNVWIWGY